jgi:hypothetical protein
LGFSGATRSPYSRFLEDLGDAESSLGVKTCGIEQLVRIAKGKRRKRSNDRADQHRGPRRGAKDLTVPAPACGDRCGEVCRDASVGDWPGRPGVRRRLTLRGVLDAAGDGDAACDEFAMALPRIGIGA